MEEKEVPPAVMQQAEFKMWCAMLDAVDAQGRPDWHKRRAAGVRVCEMLGIADAIRAVSAGGQLAIPPRWPEVQAQPVGGGPGFLDVEVATRHKDRGVMRVRVRCKVVGRKEGYEAQALEAIELGKQQIAHWLEA